MILKIIIIWFLFLIGIKILEKGLNKLYTFLIFKQIREMNPKEKYKWEKEILQECRHKAYQNKDYKLVEKISNLLEEKYND